jgi:TolB protein
LSGNPDLYKMPVEGGEPIQVTTDPAMDFSPRWSPDGKEIAFHSFRAGNRDIFVVSADGGAARQLTNDPAQEFNPHWSPDGKRVAFDSTRNGVRNEIYVISKDGGEHSGETPVRLTFDGGMAPRWSPDGGHIAYHGGGVWVIPSKGGEPRRLTDFGSHPIWSKDGQTLYFRQSPPDERAGIWLVSSSGGEARKLVRFDDPARAPYPNWSTDGENFYFTLTEFEADVWVMELEDSKE